MCSRLLMLLCVLLNLKSFGQGTFAKAGVSISTIQGFSDNASLIGYHFGVGHRKKLTAKLSLVPEIMFSAQGTKVSDNTLRYFYLNMPVLLDVRLSEKISFQVGPQPGIILHAKSKLGEEVITGQVSTIDLSACAGLSAMLGDGMSIGVRYAAGITDVERIDNGDDAFYNSMFQFSLSYFFTNKDESK